jgi:hypothetical protein
MQYPPAILAAPLLKKNDISVCSACEKRSYDIEIIGPYLTANEECKQLICKYKIKKEQMIVACHKQGVISSRLSMKNLPTKMLQ